MRFVIPSNLDGLAGYIEPFMALTGRSRWIKRLDGLSAEKDRSPYRWKIVADYHWLEMAIGFQAEILTIHGRLRPELVDPLTITSLQLAASAVEVHRLLSSKGRTVLEGRLRDALKAETGFAALYLELDLAQRVMDAGGDVAFTDLEGEAVFDYLIRQGDLVAEVECKSLSADAGRSIHRKDFYRFVDALEHALARRRIARQREILLITLEGRLSPATAEQTRLLGAAVRALEAADAETIVEPGFQIQRQPHNAIAADHRLEDKASLYDACVRVYGHNLHIAGALAPDGGCLTVMRSRRQDDASKPLLEAMRKAADQFSGGAPGSLPCRSMASHRPT